jgi:hypothetical protein
VHFVHAQDCLGSSIREEMLRTFQGREVHIGVPAGTPVATKSSNPLGAMQRDSAWEHWHVMRSLFDARDFWLRFM